MPVYVDSSKYENPLDGTPINWLFAGVGDQIKITKLINVKTYAINSSENPWVLNNTDGYTHSQPGSCWVTGGNFSEFQVGDSIMIVNYTSLSYTGATTIITKLSNSEIELAGNTGGWAMNLVGQDDAFSIMKPITAMTLKWNFVKNGEATNFFSKIDGSEQIASVGNLDPAALGTNIPMTMLGLPTWQLGSVTIDEMGIANDPPNPLVDGAFYASRFRIVINTRITPTMLAEELDNLKAGIAPDLFFNLECLRPVFYYEARYFETDPNNPQTFLDDLGIGNTGWFGEKANAAPSNYYVENLQYSYVTPPSVTPVPIPAVELSTTRRTRFQFNVRNTVDSPFSAGNTSLVLNFQKAPNDAGEYTYTSATNPAGARDVEHNFVWDSVKVKVEVIPTPINGDNYADLSRRSIANVRAFYVSPDNILVTGRFEFDQQGIDVFEESNEPTYMLFLSIQDHLKQGAFSDRTPIMVDVNANWYQTSFPDLITMNSKLIPHDVADYPDAFIDREKFTEDELVAYTAILVAEDALVSSIDLMKYTAKLVAVNTVNGNEFTLDSKSILLPQVTAANPQIPQYFNISQARPLHIPANEIRKNIIARPNQILFGSNYEFAYPFLNRWEYWIQLLTANTFFFNPGEPNLGKNHDWQHYSTGNWTIEYQFELTAKINGVPALYTDKIPYPIFNRNLSGENTTCIIKTYDPDTMAELVDGTGTKYVLGYKPTLVVAEFTNTTDNFDLNDTVINLGIEEFEVGGHFGKRRISTKYVPDADTWFVPEAGETKAKIEYIDTGTPPITVFGKVKASALLDFNSLTAPGLKYKLTARVYGNSQSTTFGTIEYGQNYLGDQEVGLIPNNPIDEDTEVLPPVKLDCCSDLVWRVLADAAGADPLKNDKNNFIWWFDKSATSTAVVYLVGSDGTQTALTGSSVYGTPYDFGFQIMPGVTVNGYNEKAVGYFIDWRKVLLTLGEDTYYLQCDITTILGSSSSVFSETYCLKQYTLERANGTVRIEYWINGILGNNENDSKARDYLQSNWYNQHRFDGVFHYLTSVYKEDEIQYSTGLIENVEHGQTPEYILKLKHIPMYKHNILRTDILMANRRIITDYNNRNLENYYQKEVKVSGNYEPKLYPLRSKLGSIEIKFKQAVNNLNKYRS